MNFYNILYFLLVSVRPAIKYNPSVRRYGDASKQANIRVYLSVWKSASVVSLKHNDEFLYLLIHQNSFTRAPAITYKYCLCLMCYVLVQICQPFKLSDGDYSLYISINHSFYSLFIYY